MLVHVSLLKSVGLFVHTHTHMCVCMNACASVCVVVCGFIVTKFKTTTICQRSKIGLQMAMLSTYFKFSSQIHTHQKLIRNDVKFLVFYIHVCFPASTFFFIHTQKTNSHTHSSPLSFSVVWSHCWIVCLCLNVRVLMYISLFCESLILVSSWNMYANAYFMHVLQSTLILN